MSGALGVAGGVGAQGASKGLGDVGHQGAGRGCKGVSRGCRRHGVAGGL